MRDFAISDKPQPVERILKGHIKAMAEVKSVLVEMLEDYERTMDEYETWYRLEIPTECDGWEKAYYQLHLAMDMACLCCTLEVISQDHYHWLNSACNSVQDMLVQHYYPRNYYYSETQRALKAVQPVPAEEYDHGNN